VITADECYSVRIADFEAEEKEKGFEGVEASVDEIAHEKIICVWNVAADSEEFHQVMELAVNVAAYCNRSVHRNHIAFFNE
jgi:L-ribulose-5-phosphate 3-epimerase UlaE